MSNKVLNNPVPQKYPADWKRISEYVRFAVHKGRCARCSRLHLTFDRYGRKVVTTCAHIDRTYPSNIAISDLTSLCRICHLGFDQNDNAAKRKYGQNYRHSGQLRLAL